MKIHQVAILSVLFGALTVDATTFQFSWTPPTEYEDGTALFEQDMDYYTLYCNGVDLLDLDVIVGTWTAEITFTEPGTYSCHLTVTAIAGPESFPSNQRVFTKGERVPQPPTLQ